jgi:hypothetical protein
MKCCAQIKALLVSVFCAVITTRRECVRGKQDGSKSRSCGHSCGLRQCPQLCRRRTEQLRKCTHFANAVFVQLFYLSKNTFLRLNSLSVFRQKPTQ